MMRSVPTASSLGEPAPPTPRLRSLTYTPTHRSEHILLPIFVMVSFFILQFLFFKTFTQPYVWGYLPFSIAMVKRSYIDRDKNAQSPECSE